MCSWCSYKILDADASTEDAAADNPETSRTYGLCGLNPRCTEVQARQLDSTTGSSYWVSPCCTDRVQSIMAVSTADADQCAADYTQASRICRCSETDPVCATFRRCQQRVWDVVTTRFLVSTQALKMLANFQQTTQVETNRTYCHHGADSVCATFRICC